jgi:hypothetical protein
MPRSLLSIPVTWQLVRSARYQRRAARAARHFEDVLLGADLEPGNEAVVLLDRQPAVLADVLAERLAADRREHILGKVPVSAIEQVDALRKHGAPTRRSARLHG